MITCPGLERRAEVTLEHVLSRGVPVQTFPGVAAKEFGIVSTVPCRSHFGMEYRGKNVTTPGHLGCWLSHQMLWRTMLFLPQESFLVFEDDVVLDHDFTQCLSVIESFLPDDWEFVHVGHCGYDEFRTVSGPLGRPVGRFPYGTHCYMMTKSCADRFVYESKPLEVAVDSQLAKDFWSRMDGYYCCVDSLAAQRSWRGEWPTSTNDSG